ncbi:ATP-grasp domain-containing protein [Marinobacter changyiensis]|uniref:ATP-grasp domain-containing protein n=1 Tax=Marinobacter changyiensis TaxID=2604091 RepID=UPI00126484E9|nr:hypothetical protein [Marinobacter changyiensis]
MHLVSFNIFRTLGLPNTQILKPEQFLQHKELLQQADWVLFPEYWQLNALVHGLKCRVFPSISSYRIGHDKIEMTRAFQTVAALHTPWTLILANGPEEREQVWQTMSLPFVAKHPKASMGEGVWLIESAEDWRRYYESADVLYVQEYLPIDRDIRVVVVGDQVVSAYWRHQAPQGFYNNVARGGWVGADQVPDSATALALQVARDLDVNHAGFDIAMVGDYPYLLEFNRLFGNQGLAGKRVQETMLHYLGAQLEPKDPDEPVSPVPLWRIAG